MRKHSKFSASGADRWMKCPGSIDLSEGVPDVSSPWAEEGTKAHEVLEHVLTGVHVPKGSVPNEMIVHASQAAGFIRHIRNIANAELSTEERIHLDFIHPEMFGTYDAAVPEHFGTLHVFDYKYGAGHGVSPVENKQMIFYGLGVAHKYQWNFSNVRLWIIQPRIAGYNGPVFWDLSILELMKYVDVFKTAVEQYQATPNKFVEGSHCHWCKAKRLCPLKLQNKQDQAMTIFKWEGRK